jgi:hypothetical protein
VLEGGAAIETDAGNARDGEFDHQRISLFAIREIARRVVEATFFKYLGLSQFPKLPFRGQPGVHGDSAIAHTAS